MYINTLTSKVNGIRQYLKGISDKASSKTTTFGEYRGIHIAIDNFQDSEGTIIQKKYTFWNNEIKLTWYKNRKKDGKFELLC